ncbi:treacle protein isoform X2 [Triplophysa rosa]|uniref:treacle protein isoform X2 n=1 Tax=Triplophysa rosa TaxID=992332 RepID=UPI002545C147|nr:treacle protein isoform X2 [Triplophysa rosa]
MHDSDAVSRPQTLFNGDDGDEANSHYIVVELKDEDLKAPTEADLSIFAPVESSECEEDEDELSDSSCVSTWRRTNTRERDNWEDVAPPERQLSSGSFKGHRKPRQNFLDGKTPKRNPECSAADRGMNEALPAEEHPCYQPPPHSDSATAPVEMSGQHTSISPLAAMEPPVFPNTPVQSKSVVGEDQHNILLEVLNYCKFLHAAVERLEQKIDRQMSYERQSKVPAEGEHLSWSLAERLGPPVQRNPQWIPPWKRSAIQQGPSRADLQVNNSNQSARPSGGGRGKGRGKGRGRQGRNNGSKRQSQTPDPALQTSGLLRDGMFTAEMDDPQPSKVMKKSSQLFKDSERKQKRRKGLEGDGDHSESEMFRKVVTLEADVDKKVMIGSSLRKVWIPLSVYKEAFKETEPQKALVPVLHSLFSNSTLSCSAVTGNPDKGIKQLDPNKIEALREFLAEMYPQYDVSLRGVTWAMCVGVINNITKDLRKKS